MRRRPETIPASVPAVALPFRERSNLPSSKVRSRTGAGEAKRGSARQPGATPGGAAPPTPTEPIDDGRTLRPRRARTTGPRRVPPRRPRCLLRSPSQTRCGRTRPVRALSAIPRRGERGSDRVPPGARERFAVDIANEVHPRPAALSHPHRGARCPLRGSRTMKPARLQVSGPAHFRAHFVHLWPRAIGTPPRSDGFDRVDRRGRADRMVPDQLRATPQPRFSKDPGPSPRHSTLPARPPHGRGSHRDGSSTVESCRTEGSSSRRFSGLEVPGSGVEGEDRTAERRAGRKGVARLGSP